MTGSLQGGDWGDVSEARWIRSASSPRVDAHFEDCDCGSACGTEPDCSSTRLDIGWAAAFGLKTDACQISGAALKGGREAGCGTSVETKSLGQGWDLSIGRMDGSTRKPRLVPHIDPWLPGVVAATAVTGAPRASYHQAGRVPTFIDEIWPTDPSIESSNSWLASLVSREDAIILTRTPGSRVRGPEIRYLAGSILVDIEAHLDPLLFCHGRLCGQVTALTHREQDSSSMLREWLDAGGIARDVVELLQYLVASEFCSESADCVTDKEGYLTTCRVISSRVYYDLWETPAEFDYYEWLHETICCCKDEKVEDVPDGPITDGPAKDK